jgi:hypothetical protein
MTVPAILSSITIVRAEYARIFRMDVRGILAHDDSRLLALRQRDVDRPLHCALRGAVHRVAVMAAAESFQQEPYEVGVHVVPLAIGLAGAPAFWVVQLIVNYGLVSYACYPFIEQRSTPALDWGSIWIAVIIINLVTLTVALATTVLSFVNWRILVRLHPKMWDDLVEASEGRVRFAALCGAVAGSGFIIAIIFDLIAILGSPICTVD